MKKCSEWTLKTLLGIILACGSVWSYEVGEIRCDLKNDPVGVETHPQFSWILDSQSRNQKQSSYRLLVSDNLESLTQNQGNCWDSGQVKSKQSLHIAYQGPDLLPGTRYYWKVKSWNQNHQATAWSRPGHFTTALFETRDWSNAQWIGLEEMADADILVPGVHPWGKNVRNLALRRPIVPMFRRDFQVNRPVERALLFICGLGHYEASMNGETIGQDFLNPGWTHYQKSCLYNTFDVTTQVTNGANAMGVIVGPGFYNVNNERYRKLLITYGMPKVIAKLKITYTDGTQENIVTDQTWKASPSPITYSSIYGGEDYDARLEQPGWNQPEFDDSAWKASLLVKSPGGVLKPQIAYPVAIRETFEPCKRRFLGQGQWLYDFEQNASGIIQIQVKGKAGQTVRIYPAELIRDNDSVNQRGSGSPYYYEYTLKGDGVETWQPRFTYYGLRYAQIEGAIPEDQATDESLPQIVGVKLLHSFNNAPRVGEFHCSKDLFNRIYKLILYGIQSNTQSVSTDCPHREKLGWLEQTYLMGGSIHYNYDLYHLYSQTIANMGDAQHDDGLIPNIAPEYVHFGGNFMDSPEWSSAGVILPWMIYQWYGDPSVMQKAWPVMERYLAYLETKATDHILSHGLGDWYDLGPKAPGYSQLTPKQVTATAIYYYDAQLMARMAALLNKPSKEKFYSQLADNIKSAFNDQYYDPNTGIYATGSQTSLAMPLCVGLVDKQNVRRVQQNLVDTITQNNKALTAGDIGFHFLVEALTEADADQLLFEMNNRDDVPGYGYQLKKGATALTESWAALSGVSNNHLMLGHLMQWFYQGLAGIQQQDDSVAYQNICIAPAFLTEFDDVMASYHCPYGLIRSEWKRSEGKITLNVTIPVNTTAHIILPTSDFEQVQESGKPLTHRSDVICIPNKDDPLQVQVGSGSYRFLINF